MVLQLPQITDAVPGFGLFFCFAAAAAVLSAAALTADATVDAEWETDADVTVLSGF